MSGYNSGSKINAGCACATDEGIWFVHYVIPILMFYSFLDERITLIKAIPCNSSLYTLGVFSGVEFLDSRLYLFAKAAKESFVYDIRTDTFKEIELCGNEDKYSFSGTCIYGDSVYAILENSKEIIKLNTHKNKVEYHNTSMMNKNINGVNYSEKRYLICACLSSNGILVYDLMNRRISEIKLRGKEYSICYADYYAGNYYGYDIDSKTVIRFEKICICYRATMIWRRACGKGKSILDHWFARKWKNYAWNSSLL